MLLCTTAGLLNTADARTHHHHHRLVRDGATVPQFAPPAPIAPDPIRDLLFGGPFGFADSSYANGFYGLGGYYGAVGQTGFVGTPGYGYGGY